MEHIELEIGNLLREKNLTLGAVESASGGLLSHIITNVPNSSDYYHGSITSYSNRIKSKVVGVREETLEKYGAVSAQVVEEMAQGGRRVLGVDICLADTGIAGPGGATPGKPVGLFFLGLAHGNKTFSQKFFFGRDREKNKQAAVDTILKWLKEYLENLK